MDRSRRYFLSGLGGTIALSLLDIRSVVAGEMMSSVKYSPVNVIIPRQYKPAFNYADPNFQYRLKRATLENLQQHFSSKPMPVWDKPFHQVDMEKRIDNIIFWLIKAVNIHQDIYPVDPIWLMALMMKESYFYEFAISSALAAGICQFVQPTAKEYDMRCAGTDTSHHQRPYRKTEFANRANEYYQIRRQRRNYIRKQRPAKTFELEEALEIIQSGNIAAHLKDVKKYLAYIRQRDAFSEQELQLRRDFQDYLRENLKGKDIFNRKDLNFILQFDERFTYKKPILAMTKMIARALRSRNGNILAASIGYNAGLSRTRAFGRYEPYGKIPHIKQSTTYLSHILINHHEIITRMG